MARLALVAALLLAAVPTLGRLAPHLAQATHAAHAGLVALCTSDGLKYVDPVAVNAGADHHGVEHGGATPDKPHDHGAPDCAYCPLLLSLLVAGCWLLWLRAASAAGALLSWPASAPRTFTHPCGLGSRGPPPANTCLRA